MPVLPGVCWSLLFSTVLLDITSLLYKKTTVNKVFSYAEVMFYRVMIHQGEKISRILLNGKSTILRALSKYFLGGKSYLNHHRRGKSFWNFLGIFVILRYLRILSCCSTAAVTRNIRLLSSVTKDLRSLNVSFLLCRSLIHSTDYIFLFQSGGITMMGVRKITNDLKKNKKSV